MGGLLPDDLFPQYFYCCGFCLTWLLILAEMKFTKQKTDYEFLFVCSIFWWLFLPLSGVILLHDNLAKPRGVH